MKRKFDVEDLTYRLPDWLMELLSVRAEYARWLFRLLDRHHSRTYKGVVALAEFFLDSETVELCAILEAHGIRFVLVGRDTKFLDTFRIVLWRPEDHSIAQELLRNRRKVPYEGYEAGLSRFADLIKGPAHRLHRLRRAAMRRQRAQKNC